MSTFYSQRGGLIRETKLPMQELELKMQGSLCARGEGIIAGFYGMYIGLAIVRLTYTELSTTLLGLRALSIITPRTCARDKAIDFSVCCCRHYQHENCQISLLYIVTKQESKTF